MIANLLLIETLLDLNIGYRKIVLDLTVKITLWIIFMFAENAKIVGLQKKQQQDSVQKIMSLGSGA